MSNFSPIKKIVGGVVGGSGEQSVGVVSGGSDLESVRMQIEIVAVALVI